MRGGVAPLTLARLPGALGSAAGAGLPPPFGRAPAWPGRPPACPPPALPPGALFFGSAITSSRSVEHLAGPPGHPNLLAVGQRLHAHPGGLVAARIHQHHVGKVDRALALDDAALPDLLGGALVLLDHVDALHHHPALLGNHAQHLALLAALLPRHHHHRVALPHVRDRHDVL